MLGKRWRGRDGAVRDERAVETLRGCGGDV